ncbi:MAG: hypothetical protein AABX79_02920 [Nanoarchaeota archaeon]
MGKGIGLFYLLIGAGIVYIRFFSDAFPTNAGVLSQYFLPIIGISFILMGLSSLFRKQK